MKNCAMQQNALAACEEMRGPFSTAGDRRQPLLWPKPRRLSQLSAAADPFRPVRWQASYQAEPSDSKAGAELLDIFLSKGGDLSSQAASSPPFFSGSPPTRLANPVVHDARFWEEKPLLPGPSTGSPGPAGSPMSSPRKSCGPTKFGFNPPPVRVEGFDCLDRRDRPTRSITAVA